MAKRIEFEFDDKLDYQLDAINSVVELFKGLPRYTSGIYAKVTRVKRMVEGEHVRNIDITEGSRLVENLNKVQLKNNLFTDPEIYGKRPNFTIEMETGTGKTYVYLRTILELNQEYGFTKFMIVVPSIAIRMGVEKSIKMLRDHFKRLYGIDIEKHSFVYNSDDRGKVSTNLVESRDLSIMIINIQAFNKERTKIRMEDEYGQILWEDIKGIRPIVIIDEPQKIEGTARKKSATLSAIEDINPLFILRYSATHKRLYNQIYKLDSFAAYEKDLVKKIEVKTVHGVIPKSYPYVRYVSFTKDLKARIEIFCREQGQPIRFKTFDVRGGASLYDLSGGLEQYRDMRLMEDPHKLRPIKISTKDGILELSVGQNNNELTPKEAIRIQIRLAIRTHLDKQFKILKKKEKVKVKVLTLFFIDSVDKVRDPSSADGRGEYLKIFDEEYERIIKEKEYQEQFEKYSDLFPRYKDVFAVREGYFARDKKNNVVDIDDWDPEVGEAKLKKKSQEDVDRGINLILDKKDELISFEEPLAFIFSHSALREGWDNPNVFVLCTLKSGGSEIAKKQEIGRGLRLPVDVNGKRVINSSINELTVIANDYYDHFAAALQKDFNDNMNFNKNEVTADIVISTLKAAGIPHEKLKPQLIDAFRQELFMNGIVNTSNILTSSADKIKEVEFKNEVLSEHSILIKEKFAEYMIKKGTNKITIKNGDNEPPKNQMYGYVKEEEFYRLFMSMSDKLKKRSIYKYNLDKERFIEECSKMINSYLEGIRLKNEYEIESGKAGFDETQRFKMTGAEKTTVENFLNISLEARSDFEIINYIMYHTVLPRFAILKILRRVERRGLLNDQEILDQVTSKILKFFNEQKSEGIKAYEIIEGYELDETRIFELDTIDEELLNEEKSVYETDPEKRKALNRYYKMDSKGEWDFARALESNSNIKMFTKLKKGGFIIETPIGNYSPDWAIVYKENNELNLYFIVETKADKTWDHLMPEEKIKIKCGKLHFDAVEKLSKDVVKFDWVNSYKDFKTKFGVKDRI